MQSAKAIIFYDSRPDAGDYLQILGRMIRIGSPNDRCYAIHLVCDDTVDERVMDVLAKKMKLVEGIIGKRLKGEEEGSDKDDNSVIKQTARLATSSLLFNKTQGKRNDTSPMQTPTVKFVKGVGKVRVKMNNAPPKRDYVIVL